MEDFGNIAEQKIKQAIARGESKNLPGEGKPLKIENFYGLPPEFIFAYTVLKNAGYLNLNDSEKNPISLTSDDIKLPNVNPANFTKNIQEKTSVSLDNNHIISSNVKHSSPTTQAKNLNYNIIRDSRRRKF